MNDIVTMTTSNTTILSVSALNAEIKSLLENSFLKCAVEGEISNVTRPASGHIYFSLKDAHSQIRCVIWRQQATQYTHLLVNGSQIVVYGRLSVYEVRGEYQLTVQHVLQGTGEGLWQLQFMQVRQRLAEAGLLSVERKRQPHRMPSVIGIITSPTAAALQDVVTSFQRRRPDIKLEIYPAVVQGAEAADSIIKALRLANTRQSAETLLLIRGGGSYEDLWAFNNEQLALEIVQSKIPVITGIGHETDVTIADLVADQRAATPTAAAELSCIGHMEILNILQQLQDKLYVSVQSHQYHKKQRVILLANQLHWHQPQQRIQRQQQQLKASQQLLMQHWHHIVMRYQQKHQKLNHALLLNLQKLCARHDTYQHQFYRLEERLLENVFHKVEHLRQHLKQTVNHLQVLSPLSVMARGFSLTYKDNQLIASLDQVATNEMITIRLQDGWLVAKVIDKKYH